MTIQRIQWTCPVCKRRYAIPATAPTPSRCPQCRQAEAEAAEEATSNGPSFPLMAQAEPEDDDEQNLETAALSALAAIQLEVAEEAARGPTAAAPVMRRNERTPSGILPIIAIVYTVLSGLAVVGAVVGLMYGLHAAFALPATPARTVVIFEAIGAFGGGLVSALTFFTFRELIHILLDIEENTRPQ